MSMMATRQRLHDDSLDETSDVDIFTVDADKVLESQVFVSVLEGVAVICGSCAERGHRRNSRKCPNFTGEIRCSACNETGHRRNNGKCKGNIT